MHRYGPKPFSWAFAGCWAAFFVMVGWCGLLRDPEYFPRRLPAALHLPVIVWCFLAALWYFLPLSWVTLDATGFTVRRWWSRPQPTLAYQEVQRVEQRGRRLLHPLTWLGFRHLRFESADGRVLKLPLQSMANGYDLEAWLYEHVPRSAFPLTRFHYAYDSHDWTERAAHRALKALALVLLLWGAAAFWWDLSDLRAVARFFHDWFYRVRYE